MAAQQRQHNNDSTTTTAQQRQHNNDSTTTTAQRWQYNDVATTTNNNNNKQPTMHTTTPTHVQHPPTYDVTQTCPAPPTYMSNGTQARTTTPDAYKDPPQIRPIHLQRHPDVYEDPLDAYNVTHTRADMYNNTQTRTKAPRCVRQHI
ncbi:hypothetical protein BYT27DRAFT_7216884 [Phlegmacium glaucopus]|nr:hypothetical protein BYT27DRAFT_7216884 [Phlegmacium glaucopus]